MHIFTCRSLWSMGLLRPLCWSLHLCTRVERRIMLYATLWCMPTSPARRNGLHNLPGTDELPMSAAM